MQHIANSENTARMAAKPAKRECRARAKIERRVEPAAHGEIGPHARPYNAAQRKNLTCLHVSLFPIRNRAPIQGRVHPPASDRACHIGVSSQFATRKRAV